MQNDYRFGMITMVVFDCEVYHPGAGVVFGSSFEEPKFGIVTYTSRTELKVSYFNEETGRMNTCSIDIDELDSRGGWVRPVNMENIIGG